MFKKQIFILAIAISISQSAFAYESTGNIQDLYISKDGMVLFRLNNPVNQRPECATNSDWDYQIDLNRPHSNDMFKMLLLSEQSIKPLTVGYGPEVECAKGISAIKVEYVLFKNLYRKNNSAKGNFVTKK